MVAYLTCGVIFANVHNVVAKDGEAESNYSEQEIKDVNSRIYALKAERNKCVSNGETDRVDAINKELETYGIYQVEMSDVKAFVDSTEGNICISEGYENVVSPQMLPEPVNNSIASWEKRTYNTVYQGVVYSIVEYNEYMGKNVSSKYFEKKYEKLEFSVNNTTYGVRLFRAIASTLINVGANVNGSLAVTSTGLSLYDAVKDVMTSVSKTTTVDNVKASFKYHTINETMFVYAKKLGDSDNSYIMAYSGNLIHSQISSSISGIKYINGKAYSNDTNAEIFFDSYSPKYNNRALEACKNYNLNKSGKNPNCNDNVYSFNVEFFNNIMTIRAIKPYYIFT